MNANGAPGPVKSRTPAIFRQARILQKLKLASVHVASVDRNSTAAAAMPTTGTRLIRKPEDLGYALLNILHARRLGRCHKGVWA